jgi:hypothetical protein
MTEARRSRGDSHFRKSAGLLLTILVCSVLSSAQAASLDMNAVLERLIESYGGEENLRKLDSQVQQWDVVALTSKRHGSDVRAIQAPDKLRVQLTYPDRQEVRIVNGDESYVSFGGEPDKKVGHPQSDAIRLQMMRLYSPLMLKAKFDALSMEDDGDDYVLTLFEHGVRVDYFVETESWRIERVVGSMAIKGQEFSFVTEYSNFAFREGVLVHQMENKYAGSVNTAVLKLRNIGLAVKVSENHFRPNALQGAEKTQTL